MLPPVRRRSGLKALQRLCVQVERLDRVFVLLEIGLRQLHIEKLQPLFLTAYDSTSLPAIARDRSRSIPRFRTSCTVKS
jgi:hypothetical protein